MGRRLHPLSPMVLVGHERIESHPRQLRSDDQGVKRGKSRNSVLNAKHQRQRLSRQATGAAREEFPRGQRLVTKPRSGSNIEALNHRVGLVVVCRKLHVSVWLLSSDHITVID